MALPNTNITPGTPPLLWSNVQEAFTQINENFDSVAAALGVAGLTPIDFETLDTSVSPTVDDTYTLGSLATSWKNVYTSEYSTLPGQENNGVWLGSAQIKGIDGKVELPAGSTVGGSLLIDPNKTFFKTINVNGNLSVEATTFGDNVNFQQDVGIGISVDSASETITFENTGVTGLTGSTYISVSAATGNVTITNTGVTNVTNSTAAVVVGSEPSLSYSGRVTGSGIVVNQTTGGVKFTNTGVLSITAGTLIGVAYDPVTGDATISNSGPQTAFRYVRINGDSVDILEADTTADTLNINSGYGINLTKTPATDTLTIALNSSIDINGSVFADDSTMLVDATGALIVGNVDNTLITTLSLTVPYISSDTGITIENNLGSTLAIGATGTSGPVVLGSGTNTVVANNLIAQGNFEGAFTGYHTGDMTGSVFADDSTILVDGVAGVLRGSLIGSVTGNIFTNLIDSADSSQIVVTPLMRFESDIIVENDITVAERLTVKGSRVINLAELKSVVAASSSFADFQTRIAALV